MLILRFALYLPQLPMVMIRKIKTRIPLLFVVLLTMWNASHGQEAGTYRATRSLHMDLLHTRLEVSFDWQKQHMHGKATLDMSPYFFPQDDVELDAKGMLIHDVQLVDKADSTVLDFVYEADKLQVKLPQTYGRQDTLRLFIEYTARPNERAIEGSEAIKADKGLYFINPLGTEKNKPQQIWTQGETESNSVWFPTVDAPNEKTTQEIFITVEERFKTLSNGLLLESKDNGDGTRTDYWKMDVPHAPYLVMMAIGEFAEVKDQWGDIPLSYMVEPAYEPYAKSVFGHTPEMMTYFTELLEVGFPWPKYTQVVVRDYVSGAMENTTASVFMEEVQSTDRELIDQHWDGIIAHELFHQWFGDLVTTESWSNLTLNEGFATYGEYLWDEYKYGEDEAAYNFLITRDEYFDEAEQEPKPLIRYYYDHREDMFDRHSYNKGGWVLHMLRNYVGDEAFFAALKLYLLDNAYETVEVAHLRLAFEEITGEDLNWFFDQWFMLPGHPELLVDHSYKDDTLTLEVQQVQDSNVHLFRLPVFVDVWVDGQKERFPIVVEEERETYKFALPQQPDLVLFDGEQQLLAKVRHHKSDKELYYQFLHAGYYTARREAMMHVPQFTNKQLKNELIDRGLDDPFYDIRQIALEHIADEEVKPKKKEEKILALTADKNPFVRADALDLLAGIDFHKYRQQVLHALEDSSYYAAASAIQIMGEANEDIPAEKKETFMQSENIHLVVALAGYFSTREQYAPYDWYLSKVEVFSGNELFYFIQYFSEMLLHADDKERKAAVSVFSDLASSHSNYIVRLSAFQALMLLVDMPGVENLLEKIKKEEKDDRLLSIYKDL